MSRYSHKPGGQCVLSPKHVGECRPPQDGGSSAYPPMSERALKAVRTEIRAFVNTTPLGANEQCRTELRALMAGAFRLNPTGAQAACHNLLSPLAEAGHPIAYMKAVLKENGVPLP